METEQKLGIKVFYYYLYKKITLGIFLLILTAVVFHFSDAQSSPTINSIIKYTSEGLLILSIITLLGGALLSYLKYISVKFSMGINAFNIKHGILSTEQISIPYRQIQGVNIEQSLSNKMVGVSRLEITTAGNDNDINKNKVEGGIFDVIDSKLANDLREKLLERANVQEIKSKAI